MLGIISDMPISSLVHQVSASTGGPTSPGTISGNILSRVTTTDNRLRRFSEILSEIINSLVAQGFLVRTAIGTWEITGSNSITADDIAALFSPTAHQFWAGPGPAFRTITADDIPAAGLTIDVSPVTGGIAGRLLYESGGLLRENSLLSFSGTMLTSVYRSFVTGSGINNERFGNDALVSNTTGNRNSAFGYKALNGNTTGDDNTGLGTQALASNTSGTGNVAIGNNASVSNTTGTSNVALGNNSLQNNLIGGGNMAIGSAALFNSTGDQNTGIGSVALNPLTSGAQNVGIGYLSGYPTLTSGTGNTFIGANTDAAAATQNYGTAIGYQAVAAANETAFSPRSDVQSASGISSTSTFRKRADITDSWIDSTDATRKARRVFNVWDTSAREAIRTDADGTNAISAVGGTVTTDTRLTVWGTALGSKVQRLTTAATNDDPNHDTIQNRVTTTDATVTTLETISISASKTYLVESRVLARRTGGTAGTADDGAVYIRRAMVTTKGGTVTINAVQDGLTQEDQAGWDCTLDVNAATIRVRVTGAVDNNITWHSTTIVQEVGS